MKPDEERGQPTPMARALMLAVRAYQVGLSGFLPPRCRFVPSCSAYALEALRIHGAARGGWLACRRICRCHPWGGHGLDPVPPREGISPREGSRPSIQSTRKHS